MEKWSNENHHHEQKQLDAANLNQQGPALKKNDSQQSFLSQGASSPMLERSTSKPTRWNCLCSPTTHTGSFRCRFHRTNSTNAIGMLPASSVGSNLSHLAAAPAPARNPTPAPLTARHE